ncbi:exodeoxyribonuclease III [Candidatus Saccharibacteria bacterium]|nr:exodeoxyribonuclease III [Candidatus Saccharibacteria bacterium]
MRLFSWNVNGIRAVLKKGALQDFLAKYQPDVLCLQEIKARPEQIDHDFASYRAIWHPAERAGYSGTAVLVRKGLDLKPEPTEADLPELAVREGRIVALDFGKFTLVNVYTPNSKPDLSRLKLREADWDPAYLSLLKTLEEKKPVITCGDFNAAFAEIDLARPKTNHHSAGFTDEERAGIANLLNAGLIDTFRTLHPDERRYTWWSHWGHARENNVGWRIDYFFLSSVLRPCLLSAEIYEGVTGSDHCPISIEMDL